MGPYSQARLPKISLMDRTTGKFKTYLSHNEVDIINHAKIKRVDIKDGKK
jgi:hypothetical protein